LERTQSNEKGKQVYKIRYKSGVKTKVEKKKLSGGELDSHSVTCVARGENLNCFGNKTQPHCKSGVEERPSLHPIM